MTEVKATSSHSFNAAAQGRLVRTVLWHGEPAGELGMTMEMGRKVFDWTSAGTLASKVLEGNKPGETPHLLKYLSPEGWLENTVFNRTSPDFSYIANGIRYLSNLTIMNGNSHMMDGIDRDAHEVKLGDYTDEQGQFVGRYSGPASDKIAGGMEEQIAALWKSPTMPKFSGAQIKIPMSLLDDGVLTVANPTPFTHILKLPGKGHFESVGAVEWMGLELSDAAGCETAKHALLDMPSGMAPALIVERFDIPDAGDEHSRMLITDFCTVGRLAPGFKRETTDKQCIEILKKASTDPQRDLPALFRRLSLAYLMCDDDAHMKNLSTVTSVDARDPDRIDVRFSPTYDAVTTAVFMPKERRMSIPIGGRYNDVSLDMLAQLGKKCGLDRDEALQIATRMAEDVARRAVEIARNPPPAIADNAECLFAVRHAATEITDRIRKMGVPVPEIDPVYPSQERLQQINAYFRKEDEDMKHGRVNNFAKHTL